MKKRDRTHRSLSSSSARFTNGLIDLRDAGMSIAIECELQDGNFYESQEQGSIRQGDLGLEQVRAYKLLLL